MTSAEPGSQAVLPLLRRRLRRLPGCRDAATTISRARAGAARDRCKRLGRPLTTAQQPEPVRCPAAEANCRSASGTIVYVERVDPDGDGDAHFVLASREGITAPGISVIDVARDLRPHPLPGVGDRLERRRPGVPRFLRAAPDPGGRDQDGCRAVRIPQLGAAAPGWGFVGPKSSPTRPDILAARRKRQPEVLIRLRAAAEEVVRASGAVASPATVRT